MKQIETYLPPLIPQEWNEIEETSKKYQKYQGIDYLDISQTIKSLVNKILEYCKDKSPSNYLICYSIIKFTLIKASVSEKVFKKLSNVTAKKYDIRSLQNAKIPEEISSLKTSLFFALNIHAHKKQIAKFINIAKNKILTKEKKVKKKVKYLQYGNKLEKYLLLSLFLKHNPTTKILYVCQNKKDRREMAGLAYFYKIPFDIASKYDDDKYNVNFIVYKLSDQAKKERNSIITIADINSAADIIRKEGDKYFVITELPQLSKNVSLKEYIILKGLSQNSMILSNIDSKNISNSSHVIERVSNYDITANLNIEKVSHCDILKGMRDYEHTNIIAHVLLNDRKSRYMISTSTYIKLLNKLKENRKISEDVFTKCYLYIHAPKNIFHKKVYQLLCFLLKNKELLDKIYFKEPNQENDKKIIKMYWKYNSSSQILNGLSEDLHDQTNEYSKHITTMGKFFTKSLIQ